MKFSARLRFILQATLLYAGLAFSWIFLSDRFLATFVDMEAFTWLSTAKGALFVLISTAVLYFVLHAVPEAEAELTGPEEPLFGPTVPGAWPRWLIYTFAVALMSLTIFVRQNLSISFDGEPILILFVPPIILSALLGGLGPGLLATLMAAFYSMYQLSPAGSLSVASSHGLFKWVLLIVSGVLVSLLSEVTHRIRQSEYLRIRQCDMVNVQLRESEARYRELFMASPLPMWVYDVETLAICAVNDAAISHYGYSSEEFLAMTIKELRPAEDIPKLLMHLSQNRSNLAGAGVRRHRKKDGSLIDVEVNTHSLSFKGRPARMVLAQDVTARLQTARALHEKEVQYRNLADAGQALIWTAGTDKLCNYFNRRWLEFTGRTLEQELGNGWTEGVHPDDFDRCLDVYVTAFDRRDPFDMEYRLRHASGEYRWLRDMGTPNYNSDGEFVGYIGHCFDITENKQAEQERKALIGELEKRNNELERFTYTVSHDLKSPLVTILGFTGQLRQDLADGDQDNVKADLNHIEVAANRMHKLLDSLLHLSRAGRTIGEPQPLDLQRLAQEALEQVGDRLAHAAVRIDFPADLPPLSGDPLRLREVFQNLLDNASKFTAGQDEPLVEVGCSTGGGEVFCYVRDNGIGIPAEYQERVFGLFEQLNPEQGGTGIGLAIVRRIVEEHGGRIWVESAGRWSGSTFHFTLPV